MRGARALATAGAVTLAVALSYPVTAPAAPGGTGGVGFELRKADVSPRQALFAGDRRPTVSFRFRARRATDVKVTVRDLRRERIVAAFTLRDARPGTKLRRPWNGVTRRGKAAPDGRYEFRVGPVRRPQQFAGSFRLRGHVFPVDGPHGTRGAVGEFGAPRNGGRTHEGFDVTGDCGTPLVAVRGGKVRRRGYDPQLYGNFVLIAGRKSDETYFYSHLIEPSPAREGEQVHTGERIGRIGQTGNAAGTPCHLHFQLTRSGKLVDPEPALRDWDRGG